MLQHGQGLFDVPLHRVPAGNLDTSFPGRFPASRVDPFLNCLLERRDVLRPIDHLAVNAGFNDFCEAVGGGGDDRQPVERASRQAFEKGS